MDRKTKGKRGEELAKKYYSHLEYEILETNYRFSRAEIDLIVLKESSLLVFVEVKQRSSNAFGDPETFVSNAQQDRIKSAAEEYIHGINWTKDIRFDIVCVNENEELKVFEDAF